MQWQCNQPLHKTFSRCNIISTTFWISFSVFAAALLCNPRLTDHCMMMLSPSPWAGDWLLVTCASGASKRRCPGTRAHMPWPAQVLSSLVMIMCNVYTGPDTRHKVPTTRNKSRGVITMNCNGQYLIILYEERRMMRVLCLVYWP